MCEHEQRFFKKTWKSEFHHRFPTFKEIVCVYLYRQRERKRERAQPLSCWFILSALNGRGRLGLNPDFLPGMELHGQCPSARVVTASPGLQYQEAAIRSQGHEVNSDREVGHIHLFKK